MTIVDSLKQRRSRYDLSDTLPVSAEELNQLVRDVTLEVPDAFNMQSQRAIIALGDSHKKLWSAIEGVYDDPDVTSRIQAFAGAAGTIVFATDTATVRDWQEKVPSRAQEFDGWAREAVGMVQLAVWTALAEVGVGASVQHYNPAADNAIHAALGLPDEWQIVSQLVIGGINSEPEPKDKIDIAQRVVVR